MVASCTHIDDNSFTRWGNHSGGAEEEDADWIRGVKLSATNEDGADSKYEGVLFELSREGRAEKVQKSTHPA